MKILASLACLLTMHVNADLVGKIEVDNNEVVIDCATIYNDIWLTGGIVKSDYIATTAKPLTVTVDAFTSPLLQSGWTYSSEVNLKSNSLTLASIGGDTLNNIDIDVTKGVLSITSNVYDITLEQFEELTLSNTYTKIDISFNGDNAFSIWQDDKLLANFELDKKFQFDNRLTVTHSSQDIKSIIITDEIKTSNVPEPSTAILSVFVLGSLLLRRKRSN